MDCSGKHQLDAQQAQTTSLAAWGESRNPLSFLFFSWAYPLLAKGSERTLVDDDIPHMRCDWHVQVGLDAYKFSWAASSKRSALLSLVYAFRWECLKMYSFLIARETCWATQAVLLKFLIEEIEADSSVYERLRWAGLMVVCSFLCVCCHGHAFHGMHLLCVRMRAAAQAMLFERCLQLPLAGTDPASPHSGLVMNLFSSDLSRIEYGSIPFFYLAFAPLHIIAVGLLGTIIFTGPASLGGLGVVILYCPFQLCMARLFEKFRRPTSRLADKRIQSLKDLVNNMQAVKMYSWEIDIAQSIQATRNEESAWLFHSARVRSAVFAAANMGALLQISTVACILWASGQKLHAGDVFGNLALLLAVQATVGTFSAAALEKIAELRVCDQRLTHILKLTETRRALRAQDTHTHQQEEQPALEFANATVRWKTTGEIAFKHISACLNDGELLVVSGPVGCGKTALLLSLLGEVQVTEGSINCPAQQVIAYVEQQPFILQATLRDNIALGREATSDELARAVHAAGLRPDLKILPGGLDTHIGERGITLSGGQRCRVALARAVLSGSCVQLLDDPLAALDSDVAKHVVDKCILGAMASATRVLTTHQVDLVQQCVAASSAVAIFLEMEADGTVKSITKIVGKEHAPRDIFEVDPLPAQSDFGKQVELVAAEERAKGDIPWSVYSNYFRAGGGMSIRLFSASSFFVSVALVLGGVTWISRWCEASEEKQDDVIWLVILAVFVVTSVGMLLLRGYSAFHILICSARRIHDSALLAVVKAPLLFFQSSTTGRIINRFSKDVGILDDMLTITCIDTFRNSVECLGTVILACIAIPPVIVVVPPLLYRFLKLRRFYLRTSRDLKRIEGTSRSPVFACLATSLSGLPTVRAYGLQDLSVTTFFDALNKNTACLVAAKSCERWFGMRLDLLVFALGAAATIMVACLTGPLGLSSGIAAAALTYVMQLAGLFQYTVRLSAELVNFMTSAERLSEFTATQPEADKGWVKGFAEAAESETLCFKDVSFRWRPELPVVLQQVSFTVMRGQKCGIVGRTGSGKSSLAAVLLRLAPTDAGSVYLHGVNAQDLQLSTLRRAIAVLPQTPTLFAGTVRFNLNPSSQGCDQVSKTKVIDKAVEDVLSQVGILDIITNLPHGIESEISEEGSMLSAGEKQLLCLARALLMTQMSASVLVMDEATSACDDSTDRLVQDTIARVAGNVTSLVIAHRLQTVLDAHTIIVLDQGQIQAIGTPQQIFVKSGGGIQLAEGAFTRRPVGLPNIDAGLTIASI